MTWHYQIRRSRDKHGPIYDIVEVYTKPNATTVEGIAPISETRRGLIQTLEMILRDVKKYRTLNGGKK